jgi:glutamine amidotransferase
MVSIIDYGMGNIHSVNKALQFYGAKTTVTNNPKEIRGSDKVVLPGVGAFDDAILELERQGLISVINEHIKEKKSFLGICLGLQLLFEESEEANRTKGLGILKGTVRRFSEALGFKVPHMGWNQIKVKDNGCPLLRDIPDNSYVYFCHSYYPRPEDSDIIAATTDYGIDFASIIWQDNIYGVQFHPEKSQAVGLKILKNFVNL